jgi:hypothetical protein
MTADQSTVLLPKIMSRTNSIVTISTVRPSHREVSINSINRKLRRVS